MTRKKAGSFIGRKVELRQNGVKYFGQNCERVKYEYEFSGLASQYFVKKEQDIIAEDKKNRCFGY